jgi:hypothetical protein
MKLKIGQTWQLLSGEIVTIVTLPDKSGWLTALSHDVDHVRTYGLFGFDQPGVRLLEVKSDTVATDVSLRAILKEIVFEVLAKHKAEKKKKKKRGKRR